MKTKNAIMHRDRYFQNIVRIQYLWLIIIEPIIDEIIDLRNRNEETRRKLHNIQQAAETKTK